MIFLIRMPSFIFAIILLMTFKSCEAAEQKKDTIPTKNTNQQSNGSMAGMINFRYAAKKATPCVVHIKSTFPVMTEPEIPEMFRDFFGDDFWKRYFKPEPDRKGTVVGSASGVIISNDGYIVTNYHVVQQAQQIEVVMHNRQSYIAKIVGIDPATDLALIKLDIKNIPFIEFGNSDSAEVGDFVLAVGNPFNLASTVTAGIISAKARNINIINEKGAVESYIQTDAAINMGNSGGALVDMNGKLIGINSAIATPTGAYAGYSFAIPVELVLRVVNDLKKFGKVKRGKLGIFISDNNGARAKTLASTVSTGVVVDSIIKNSAAEIAGLQKNDIIIEVDNHPIDNAIQLREIISRMQSGQQINITIIRNGKRRTISAKIELEKEVAVIRTEIVDQISNYTASSRLNHLLITNIIIG